MSSGIESVPASREAVDGHLLDGGAQSLDLGDQHLDVLFERLLLELECVEVALASKQRLGGALARARAAAISAAACSAASSPDASGSTPDAPVGRETPASARATVEVVGTISAIPARIAQSARMCTERYPVTLVSGVHPASGPMS
ncbi:MAG: hypothetical protein R2713_19185 [Ilumatobacteraceae bacterium]